eukprot:scaffold14148_cov74-Phaeocystis_antarctica.AAC.2
MTTARRTSAGYMIAHSRACMPPADPPTTAWTARTPSSCTSSSWCSRTVSRIVVCGKSPAYLVGVWVRLGVARVPVTGRLGGSPIPRPHPGRGLGDGVERTRRAVARAEHVRTDHEVPARVQGPALAEQGCPPRVDCGVARERVGHEEAVVRRGRERAPGAVGDAHVRQHASRLQLERRHQEVAVVVVHAGVLISQRLIGGEQEARGGPAHFRRGRRTSGGRGCGRRRRAFGEAHVAAARPRSTSKCGVSSRVVANTTPPCAGGDLNDMDMDVQAVWQSNRRQQDAYDHLDVSAPCTAPLVACCSWHGIAHTIGTGELCRAACGKHIRWRDQGRTTPLGTAPWS